MKKYEQTQEFYTLAILAPRGRFYVSTLSATILLKGYLLWRYFREMNAKLLNPRKVGRRKCLKKEGSVLCGFVLLVSVFFLYLEGFQELFNIILAGRRSRSDGIIRDALKIRNCFSLPKY